MTDSEDRRGDPELERQVRARVEWFHNFDFDAVRTTPDHLLGHCPREVWRRIAEALPNSLTGKSVLDIGCNAGSSSPSS